MQGFAWLMVLAFAPLACAPCPKGAASSPTAATAPGAASEPGIEVKVDSDGRAYVGGAPAYKSEDFARAVAEQKRARPTDSATIYADARVPHGRVVAVKKELENAGIVHVAFALAGEPHPEPPPAAAPMASTPPVASTPPEPPPAPPPSAEPLPEVKVEAFGLHIGGGPNDDATKKPILDAISKHFDAFRACYVKVQDPAKGGTFGVDLRIGRDGGSPKVEQPRTGMKGNEFRECVLDVFKHVTFEKPPKGPTVVSYSLRFSLGK